MLKNIALFFGIILVLIAGGIVFAYHQYPQARMQITILQKTLKIKAGTEKLIADHTCSDELEKAECFENFVSAMGGVEFAVDLTLFSTASYKICHKNPYYVMANTDKLLSRLDVKNLWVFQNGYRDPEFFEAVVNVEKNLVDKYLRVVRKTAFEKFQTEGDESKKNDLVQYVKAIDAKIIELVQAN